jgi:molybdopterin-binding protein
MELLRVPDAARALGVSYPTLKQWIYRGRIRSVKTAGGHHRIPRPEIDRLLFQETGEPAKPDRAGRVPAGRRRVLASRTVSESGLEHFISGRNQLVGRVSTVEIVGLLAKVTLDIGGRCVTAIITRDACRDLRLKVGETVAALIKATEVMIIRPVPRARS